MTDDDVEEEQRQNTQKRAQSLNLRESLSLATMRVQVV